jgi:hypothetical protein
MLYTGILEEKEGNRDKAIKIFKDIMNRDGDHFKCIKELARIQLECKDPKI